MTSAIHQAIGQISQSRVSHFTCILYATIDDTAGKERD